MAIYIISIVSSTLVVRVSTHIALISMSSPVLIVTGAVRIADVAHLHTMLIR